MTTIPKATDAAPHCVASAFEKMYLPSLSRFIVKEEVCMATLSFRGVTALRLNILAMHERTTLDQWLESRLTALIDHAYTDLLAAVRAAAQVKTATDRAAAEREWMRHAAEMEDGRCVSVGGLAAELGMMQTAEPLAEKLPADAIPFGRDPSDPSADTSDPSRTSGQSRDRQGAGGIPCGIRSRIPTHAAPRIDQMRDGRTGEHTAAPPPKLAPIDPPHADPEPQIAPDEDGDTRAARAIAAFDEFAENVPPLVVIGQGDYRTVINPDDRP